MTKDEPDNGFIITPFLDSKAGNCFEIWLQTIRQLTRPGKSQVFTKDCPILRRSLHNTPLRVCKKSLADFPIISCFGGLVHSLSRQKTWEEYVKKEKLIDCMGDEFFLEARAQREIIEALYGYETEDDDYLQDEPISTMPV